MHRSAAELAFARRAGLRARLDAVLDTGHDVRPLARGWAAPAMLATLAAAGAMGAVRIAPSRAVLTTLMQDVRWESRAYAVVGLAQRADSIAVARSAAERDPSPRVRAWARYALGAARRAARPPHHSARLISSMVRQLAVTASSKKTKISLLLAARHPGRSASPISSAAERRCRRCFSRSATAC